MLEHIDTSLIDWSRAQFALTAIYPVSYTHLDVYKRQTDKDGFD